MTNFDEISTVLGAASEYVKELEGEISNSKKTIRMIQNEHWRKVVDFWESCYWISEKNSLEANGRKLLIDTHIDVGGRVYVRLGDEDNRTELAIMVGENAKNASFIMWIGLDPDLQTVLGRISRDSRCENFIRLMNDNWESLEDAIMLSFTEEATRLMFEKIKETEMNHATISGKLESYLKGGKH